MQTRLLTQSDVLACVSMQEAITAVESAFRHYALGQASMPPKIYLDVPGSGDFRAMPACIGNKAGIKWVSVHPQNPKQHNLPTVMATLILNDAHNAHPLAIMDATMLTAFRTGAAAAVSSKYLAMKNPKRLGIIGCGVQGRHLVDAHRVLFPDIEVLVADSNSAAAAAFATRMQARVVSMQEAAGAEILCTATPSYMPIVKRAWLASDVHINAMGADAQGKQELESTILQNACIFVDDTGQAHHSGEVNVPLSQGIISAEQASATLGEVIAGKRLPPDRPCVSVFDSTGLAIQDIAIAQIVLHAAEQKKIGQQIDFLS